MYHELFSQATIPLKLTTEQKAEFTQYVLDFYEGKQINITNITNNITRNPQIVLKKLLMDVPKTIIDGVTINSSLFLNSLTEQEKQNFIDAIKNIVSTYKNK